VRSLHIGDWSRKGLTYYGDAVALVDVAKNRRFTYRDLDARATGLAVTLRARFGVRKGDRFAMLAHNGVEVLDCLFAGGKLGAILVPYNWRLHPRELTELAESITPRMLFHSPELAETAGLMGKAAGCPTVALDAGYEALLGATGDVHEDVEPEDIACFLFTGGTTGLPKAARLSHRMLAWNSFNTAIHEVHHGDVTITHTPMFHTGGLFVHTLPALVMGGRVVLMRRWDTEEMVRLVAEERVTVFFCVPSQYVALLQSPTLPKADWRSVRFMTSGGAPLPVEVQRAFRALHDIPFKQGFGMTEFGPGALTLAPADAQAHVGSVGRPNYFVEASIQQQGRMVVADEVGELCFRGPALFSGYYDRAGTAPFVDAQGWFHSGDLARADAQGFLTIVGREKDMFISGGENVYPIEVEAILHSHPAVADCAVVGVPDAKWGEVGVAYVVLKPNHSLEESPLLAFLGDRLARYKLPRRIVFRDALPLSPVGKILKGALREEAAS